MKKPAPTAWDPPELDEFDVRAFKALNSGTASDSQQQRALKIIIELFCGTYDQSFRPGPDGHRATDFSEGKRWVGNRIVNAIKRPVESKETS